MILPVENVPIQWLDTTGQGQQKSKVKKTDI